MKPSEEIFAKINKHLANGKDWDVAAISAIIEFLDEQHSKDGGK